MEDTFIDFVFDLQNNVLFPRLKEENVDGNACFDLHLIHEEVIHEEIDDWITGTSFTTCDRLLLDYGLEEALELYDNEYGLEQLKELRVQCLLYYAVRNALKMDEYKEWLIENTD